MSRALTISDPGAAPRGRPALLERLRSGDEFAHLVTLVFAATAVLIVVLLVMELYGNSAEAREKFGWNFFVTRTWDPISGAFGSLPFIYGTVVTSALALLISVPLGLGAAIFLAELAPPRISDILTFI